MEFYCASYVAIMPEAIRCIVPAEHLAFELSLEGIPHGLHKYIYDVDIYDEWFNPGDDDLESVQTPITLRRKLAAAFKAKTGVNLISEWHGNDVHPEDERHGAAWMLSDHAYTLVPTLQGFENHIYMTSIMR